MVECVKQYLNCGLVRKNSGAHPCTFQDQVLLPGNFVLQLTVLSLINTEWVPVGYSEYVTNIVFGGKGSSTVCKERIVTAFQDLLPPLTRKT